MLRTRSILSRLIEPKSSISLSGLTQGNKALAILVHVRVRQSPIMTKVEILLLLWHCRVETPATITRQRGSEAKWHRNKWRDTLSEGISWISRRQSHSILHLFSNKYSRWIREMMIKAVQSRTIQSNRQVNSQALALAHMMRDTPPGFRLGAKTTQPRSRRLLIGWLTNQAPVLVALPLTSNQHRCTASLRLIAQIPMLAKYSNKMIRSSEGVQVLIARIPSSRPQIWDTKC